MPSLPTLQDITPHLHLSSRNGTIQPSKTRWCFFPHPFRDQGWWSTLTFLELGFELKPKTREWWCNMMQCIALLRMLEDVWEIDSRRARNGWRVSSAVQHLVGHHASQSHWQTGVRSSVVFALIASSDCFFFLKHLHHAIRFDATIPSGDVVCLQEVPDAFLSTRSLESFAS